jgi:hypothetical protein
LEAQWYGGIEAGANRNYLTSNTADKPFFDYEHSNGFSVAVPIRYQFPSLSWFGGIQVSPAYVQKNYRIQRTGAYADMYQQTNNTYIELPVMAQFRFGGNIAKTQSLHGFLNLGGYSGYWLSGHVEGRSLSPMDQNNYQSYEDSYTFSDEKDRRFEFGGLAGVGLQYTPNKQYVISIEGRYTPSFTDQQKSYSENQTPRYNDTYSLLLGVQYQLSSLFRSKKQPTAK